jgi:hypothetical protein
MEHASFRRQELVIGSLLDECVPEAIALAAPIGLGDEQLGLDGLAQRGAEIGLGQTGDLGQHIVLDLATGDGRDLDEVTGRL